jgi:hypothetical protein
VIFQEMVLELEKLKLCQIGVAAVQLCHLITTAEVLAVLV